jgi:hypothetical protein
MAQEGQRKRKLHKHGASVKKLNNATETNGKNGAMDKI